MRRAGLIMLWSNGKGRTVMSDNLIIMMMKTRGNSKHLESPESEYYLAFSKDRKTAKWRWT